MAAENEVNSYQAGLASAALEDSPVNAMNIGTAEAALTALRLRFDGQDAAELRNLSQAARKVMGDLPALSTYQTDGSLMVATVRAGGSGIPVPTGRCRRPGRA